MGAHRGPEPAVDPQPGLGQRHIADALHFPPAAIECLHKGEEKAGFQRLQEEKEDIRSSTDHPHPSYLGVQGNHSGPMEHRAGSQLQPLCPL